jgi:hypothetical protein
LQVPKETKERRVSMVYQARRVNKGLRVHRVNAPTAEEELILTILGQETSKGDHSSIFA